jgi:hypothetical protein
MPRIDLDILNQLQTPAFYASSLATRPAFGFVGRIFIDSDNPSTGLYRDTGTAWIQIADPGAGTSETLQQVTTNGNSTTTGITITTNGLGIGTTIPGSNRLDIHSASGINATFNGTGTTNAALQLQSAGVGKWYIRNNYNAGSNDFQIFDVLNNTSKLSITNAGIGTFTGNFNVTTQITCPQYQFTNSTSLASQTGGNTNIYSGSNSLIITDNTGAISIVAVNNSTYAANFKGSVTSNGLSSKSDGFFLTTTALTPNVGQIMAWYNSVGTRRAYFGYGSSGDDTFSLINETGGSNVIGGVTNFNNAINIGNSVAVGVAVASTHKVSILINGVQYYLLASNV